MRFESPIVVFDRQRYKRAEDERGQAKSRYAIDLGQEINAQKAIFVRNVCSLSILGDGGLKFNSPSRSLPKIDSSAHHSGTGRFLCRCLQVICISQSNVFA